MTLRTTTTVILHYSVFQIERLIRNVAVSFALSLDAENSEIDSHLRSFPE